MTETRTALARLTALREKVAKEVGSMEENLAGLPANYWRREETDKSLAEARARLATLDAAVAKGDDEEAEWAILESTEGRAIGSTAPDTSKVRQVTLRDGTTAWALPYDGPRKWVASSLTVTDADVQFFRGSQQGKKLREEPIPECDPFEGITTPLPTAVYKYPGSMSASLLDGSAYVKKQTRHFAAKAPVYEDGVWVNKDGPTVVGEKKAPKPRAAAPVAAPAPDCTSMTTNDCLCPHCGKRYGDPVEPKPAPKARLAKAARTLRAAAPAPADVEALRDRVKQSRISLATLAQRTGHATSTLSAILNARRSAPHIQQAIADALGGTN